MRAARRVVNGLRKVYAGLTPFGESVWPGVRNDLFVAHTSIYEFFSKYVQRDASVVDAGCGVGYGTASLVENTRSRALGLDVDRRSIRYARRHYGSDDVRFEVADLNRPLALPDSSCQAIVSSNCLEHLDDPSIFISEVSRLLEPRGVCVIVVPPITTGYTVEHNREIHYHRSNLKVTEWHDLFVDHGFDVQCFRHTYIDREPDFRDPYPSRLTTDSFVFEPLAGVNEYFSCDSISAVFELRTRA